MIIKIFNKNNEIAGIHAYENNENGEVFLHDTFHCDAKEDGYDTIFGTNDEQITIQLKGDSIMEERICYLLEEAVSNKFNNLDFVQNDYDEESKVLTWTIVDDCEPEEQFFYKMQRLKEYVESLEYTVRLKEYPRNCKFDYSEVNIDINIYGEELE